MLVLSRQRDEAIIIGENIVVTVIDVRGDKVRLGIDAPAEVPVHRREVYDAIRRENPIALSKSYQQLTEYLETEKFQEASRLYFGNPSVRGLMTGDQRLKLEKGLGRKLEEQ